MAFLSSALAAFLLFDVNAVSTSAHGSNSGALSASKSLTACSRPLREVAVVAVDHGQAGSAQVDCGACLGLWRIHVPAERLGDKDRPVAMLEPGLSTAAAGRSPRLPRSLLCIGTRWQSQILSANQTAAI